MIIVGGTYSEIVVEPDSSDLVGSGVRAAAAIARREGGALLHTAVEEDLVDEAGLVADALQVIRGQVIERTEAVGFRYMTPISSPLINGPNSRLSGEHLQGQDTTALIFGLVEAPQSSHDIHSDIAVIDPQKPRDSRRLDLAGVHSGRYVIVANQAEIRQLGNNLSLDQAAANMFSQEAAVEAVVIKRGASGCLVAYRAGQDIRTENIGAHPTTRVWPIGSGDVFSAGLAHAMDSGADVVQAARVGSASAAHWCLTRQPEVPLEILSGDSSSLPRPIEATRARVYLAGPFFTVGERWLIETVREQLFSLGVEVWSPVHEVGHAEDVAKMDLDGLESCDAVLALLDHSDSGTVFEVGWAIARNIPVVAYGGVVEREGVKMMSGTGVELHRDLSTACYRAAWSAMGLRPRAGWIT